MYGDSSRSARAAAAAARSSRPGSAAGLGVPGEHDLVALPDHALGERLAAHPAVAAARTADERRLHPPPGLVGDEGEPPAGQADLAQQRVLVGHARGPSATGRCSWRTSTSLRAAGAPAQLVADVEQEGVGRLDLRGRLVAELGGGDGAQHLPLAQPAVGLLEVGLEQEGQLADLPGAAAAQVAQLGQQPGRRLPPAGEGRRPEPGGELGVAGDEPGVEQARARP